MHKYYLIPVGAAILYLTILGIDGLTLDWLAMGGLIISVLTICINIATYMQRIDDRIANLEKMCKFCNNQKS